MKYSEKQALAKIAAYCSKAERSEFDVRRKLQNWEMSNDEVLNIIKHLKDEKFLDEDRFCEAYIKDKIRFNKWGKSKIVYELKKKQISERSITRSFENIDTDMLEDQLLSVLLTKLKSVKANNDYERRNKLIRFALGRGYQLDQIIKTLSTILKIEKDEFVS